MRRAECSAHGRTHAARLLLKRCCRCVLLERTAGAGDSLAWSARLEELPSRF